MSHRCRSKKIIEIGLTRWVCEIMTKCQCLECDCMSEGEADLEGKYICNFCKMGNHEDKY